MAAAHSPDTASRKRARTESVTDVTQDIQIEDVDEVPQVKHEGITRNEEIWFEDGSVVLVAADVGFRVHAGILSLHSTVFSELLHGPEMMLEQLDGCPVLRVSDTTADLGVFLTFLYAGIDSVELTVKKLPFSKVAALVRLGHKYQVHRLRDNGLARLKSCFPDKWSSDGSVAFAGNRSAVMSMVDQDAISAVNLAHLTQTDSILPMALYGCCQLSIPTLLSGIQRPDGTVDKLSSEDVIRCLVGKDKLMAAKRSSFAWIFEIKNSLPQCVARENCNKTTRSLPKMAHLGNILSTIQVFKPLLLAVPEIRSGLCRQCRLHLQCGDNDAMSGIFTKLPSYMGVTVKEWPRYVH